MLPLQVHKIMLGKRAACGTEDIEHESDQADDHVFTMVSRPDTASSAEVQHQRWVACQLAVATDADWSLHSNLVMYVGMYLQGQQLATICEHEPGILFVGGIVKVDISHVLCYAFRFDSTHVMFFARHLAT